MFRREIKLQWEERGAPGVWEWASVMVFVSSIWLLVFKKYTDKNSLNNFLLYEQRCTKLHHYPQQKCPSWLADVEQCVTVHGVCVRHVYNMLNKCVSLKQRGGQPLHTSDCVSEMVCVLEGLKLLGLSWQKNKMVPSLKWKDPLSILSLKKHVSLGVV